MSFAILLRAGGRIVAASDSRVTGRDGSTWDVARKVDVVDGRVLAVGGCHHVWDAWDATTPRPNESVRDLARRVLAAVVPITARRETFLLALASDDDAYGCRGEVGAEGATIVEEHTAFDDVIAIGFGWDNGVARREALCAAARLQIAADSREATMVSIARAMVNEAASDSPTIGGPVHVVALDADGPRWLTPHLENPAPGCWPIDVPVTAGSLSAATGTFAGELTAASGTISGELVVGTGGSLSSGATAYGTGTGYWLDHNGGTPRLRVGNPSGDRLVWTGSALEMVSENLSIDANGLWLSPFTTADGRAAINWTSAATDAGAFRLAGYRFTDGIGGSFKELWLIADNRDTTSTHDNAQVRIHATNGTAVAQVRAEVASGVSTVILDASITRVGVLRLNDVPDFNLSHTGSTASAGAATLPANPAGFLHITVDGTAYRVPVYNT
jgi:hypothetical protein